MRLAVALLSAATLTDAFTVAGPALQHASRHVFHRAPAPTAGLLEDFLGGAMSSGFEPPVVMGTEEMMSQKEFGTSAVPIQKDLRWSCDVETADRICNYNRHYAEYGGYWERATSFLQEESEASGEITFYDSNTGKVRAAKACTAHTVRAGMHARRHTVQLVVPLPFSCCAALPRCSLCSTDRGTDRGMTLCWSRKGTVGRAFATVR
jgi:hypothetical protein